MIHMRKGLLFFLTAMLALTVSAARAEEGSGLRLTGDESNPTGLTVEVEDAGAAAASAGRPVTSAAEHIKLFRYQETLVLRGIFEKSGYFFRIPDYWDTRYVLAQIEYTVSPMIQGVPATLTFYINSHPIHSSPVEYEAGASQIVYVPVPLEYLTAGYNEFDITGYVRLYDDEECLDDFSGASWVSISESSFIEVGYDLVDTGCQLSYYPYPLISSMDPVGSDLTVYVPEQALEEELRAAFLLRADLGNETDGEDRIGFKALRGSVPDAGNALIIAQTDRLPADILAHMPSDAERGQDGALVYEYGGNGRWVMVVTAEKAEHLTEAAFMLVDTERVTQEKYNWAFVAAGTSETVVASRSLSSLVENGETIKGITNQDGLEFIGPFHQESTVYLPFSGGFVLGEGGKVELLMRYSDNLDFDRSMVTVYWGSTPVASRKLSQEKADLDVFSFMMPSDVVGTHAASIRIAFDLEIKELYCTKRADEMPWAYVSGDSTLYFPSGNASTYDLALRPYPFQRLGLFNSVAVVVPDRMDENEYAAFGRVAALMGADIQPYGLLRVWYASHFPTEENAHIIVIGTYQDNQQLQALNDQLSFHFSEDGSRFESNEQLLLSERYAAEVASLQLIRSPYQEGKAVLAVCAPDTGTLTQLDRFAAVQRNTWTLAGDTFLIDRDLETKSFRFLQNEPAEQLSLRERLEQNRDAILMTLVSTSVMLIMLIAVILILLRYRRNRREEEKK